MNIPRVLSIILFSVSAIAILYLATTNLPSKTLEMKATTTPNSNYEDFSLTYKLSEIKNKALDIIKGSNDYINVAIFGIPGEGYIASNLTDTIMVLRYEFDKNKLFIISIPRDLWISDSTASFKINEALFRDGVDFTLGLIQKITGLKSDGYVIVDLNTIKDVVDWLGGIDVYLDEPAIDWVSGYALEKGLQHLNGEDVVWLIRNRYNTEGDFFREKNQQKVIDALVEKFSSLPKNKKYEFVKEFVFNSNLPRNVNLDFSKLTPLILSKNSENIKIRHIILSPSTNLTEIKNIPIEGNATTTYISVVMPKEGFGKYDKIREYISNSISEE